MRRRIALIVTLVTAAALVGLMVPTALAIRERALYAAKLELQRESAQLAASLGPDEPLLVSSLELITNGEVHVVGVYGPDGRLAGGSGPPRADALVTTALTGTFAESAQESEYVAVAPAPRGASTFAAVRVAESYADPNADAWRHLRPVLALAVAVLVAAAGTAWWLGRSMTQPLVALRTVAMRVGRGDRSTEIPITGFAELDDLGATIGSMADELEQQLTREQSFSAQVSHQLRTPITALQVALEAELSAPRSDPTVAIGEALGAVGRLNITIAELLSIARGHANDRGEFRLDHLAAEVARAHRDRFAARGRELDTELEPVTVLASRSAITHIVDVLVENSVRHGKGPTCLRTTCTDDGPLLSIDDAARISRDPFVAPVKDGHGIGLKLARGLASAEGARLLLAPGPEHTGHRFELRFEALGDDDPS